MFTADAFAADAFSSLLPMLDHRRGDTAYALRAADFPSDTPLLYLPDISIDDYFCISVCR